MRPRTFLILAAVSALSATPVFAQQKPQQPTKVASIASRDTTKKATTHKRRSTTTVQSTKAATPAVPATPSSSATTANKTEHKPTADKSVKHRTKSRPKKVSTDTTKKPTGTKKN